MADPTPRLREGVLGRFWMISEPNPGALQEIDAIHGSLRLLEDGVMVRLLLPDVADIFADEATDTGRQKWLFGITEGGGTLIVPTLTRDAHQLSLFGNHTSVRTLRGPAVIAHIGTPFGPRVTDQVVKLPHPEWAGLQPVNQTGHLDNRQRWKGLDIQLRGTEPIRCGRAGSIEVDLEGGWNQSYGDTDGHHSQIWASLDVVTRAVRPRSIGEQVDVAQRVQDLVSLAYDRQLPAYSCRVRLEAARDDADPSWLWHYDLNAAAVQAAGPHEPPYFHLDDLGSPNSVTRWVELTRRFPDASEAVCPRTRLHTQTARLLQLGIAIEKYVGGNTRQSRSRGRAAPAWTKRKGRTDTYAAGLARHAGSAFAGFVGDPDSWGTAFTDAYNSAKHPYAATGVEPGRTLFYNLTAQLLLTSVLLDRAARSQKPSTTMLADRRLQEMSAYAHRLTTP